MSTFRRSRSLPSSTGEVFVNAEATDIKTIKTRRRQVNNSGKAFSKTHSSSTSGSKASHRSPTAPDEYKDPFFDPPPALGVRSEPLVQSSNSDDTPNLDSLLESDSLLHVEIISSVEGSNFYIPVSLMVEREIMMRKTAEEFGIGQERWASSLLYREWRNAQDDISSTADDRAFQQSNGDVSIYLNPEADCASSNHSHSLKWTPWLTTCIRAFYNTGTVRFPNDCVGSDVLLALEYFGIVYTPDQLVFDSFGAYLRVKLWSEYFTHRSGLAQWVVETLMQTNSKHSHIFVTSPSLQEGDLLVGSKRADVLDGHLQLDPTKYAGTPSNAVVHDFFHDEERPEVVEYPLDALMREDFAHYLQNSLPGTRVTFELKDVQVVRTGKTVKRATLQVTFVEPPKEVPRNSSSKPKKTQKDAPGRQASRTRKSADVAKLVPSVEKLNTIEKGPLGRPHTRSPSPVALLKRVGSAIRKSSSSVDASTEHSQSKQGNVNVPSTPVSDPKLTKVSSASSVEKVQEPSSTKPIQEKSTAGSDHGNGLQMHSITDSDRPCNGTDTVEEACPPSPAPSDEHILSQLRARHLSLPYSAAPSDEYPKAYVEPRVPVKAIWEGDSGTVVSALTSPFRDDESTKKSTSSAVKAVKAAAKAAPVAAATPESQSKGMAAQSGRIDVSEIHRVQPKPLDSGAVEVVLAPEVPTKPIVRDESSVDSVADVFLPSTTTTDASALGSAHHVPYHSGVSQCGGGDILSSTFTYMFGKTTSVPCKTLELQTNCPKASDMHLDMASLARRGQNAISVMEDMLPDIDIHTQADETERSPSSGSEGLETIESSAAAWLRRAINFNQMIFDDPVPVSDDDEYLRLVRQAETINYSACQSRATGMTGTLVKDILDSLMNDNNSHLGGSAGSAEESTVYSTLGSVSTPSTRLTKAGPFIPFDCDSSLDSGDHMYPDMSFISPALPRSSGGSGGDGGSCSRSATTNATNTTTPSVGSRGQRRERLRFPTPRKNVDRPLPRNPNRPKDESRSGTPTTSPRHASPLSRIPALMSARKRGKNRGDETTDTEMTPKIHNGVKMMSLLPGAGDDEQTGQAAKPSRIAGLFRSKGLVRRRSLGEGGSSFDQHGSFDTHEVKPNMISGR
jgi:hypothetical protein